MVAFHALRPQTTHSGPWIVHDKDSQMNGQTRPLKKTLIALGAGILVGVTLVTAFGFFSAGSDALLPPPAKAQASFLLSIYYAPTIAILSAPIWLAISRFGLDGPGAAAGLGFVMTSTVWFLANQPFLGPTMDDLAIAVCGAVAGFATWWVASRR
jgi:hypothetical protein